MEGHFCDEQRIVVRWFSLLSLVIFFGCSQEKDLQTGTAGEDFSGYRYIVKFKEPGTSFGLSSHFQSVKQQTQFLSLIHI